MTEALRPEVKQFIHGLIPIKGVDFSKPWKEIVLEINPQLQKLRYETYQVDKPYSVMFGNLDNLTPSDPDTFDPVIVDHIYGNENTPQPVRVAAKLGLQAGYWEGLSILTTPFNRPGLPYEKAAEFVILPVFTKGNRTYLEPSDNQVNSVGGIEYGGDGDMINYAESRVFKSEGLHVPFSTLGIHNETLDHYIALREKLDVCKDKAQKNALLSYREKSSDVWNELKRIYPRLDEVVDATEKFDHMYLSLARELITDAMGLKGHTYPPAIATLIDTYRVDLATFLHFQTRHQYGIELFRDRDFYNAIDGLGEVTRQMYDTALKSL